MNRKPSLLARLLTGPFVVLHFVIDTIHAALFGWWLPDLQVKKANKHFLADIRGHLGFLFDEYNARILPNDPDPPAYFDWAKATISVKDLILEFYRDRGTVTVRVASSRAPKESYELPDLLNAAGEDIQRGPFSHLLDVEPVLRRHMDKIENAFSGEKFASVKEQISLLSEHDEGIRRQWESEINRRLYQ